MSLFKPGLVLIAAALTAACASLQNAGSSAAVRQQLTYLVPGGRGRAGGVSLVTPLDYPLLSA